MKTIQIVVSPGGQTRVQTLGFSGTACREADAFLRRSLGRETNEQRTAESFVDTVLQQPSHA